MNVPERTPELRSARTVLRPFRPDDIDGRVRCGKDPAIMRMFGGSPDFSEPVPMPVEDATAWYRAVSSDSNPLNWAVESEGMFMGTARLHGLDEIDRRARSSIGLLDAGRLGMGLGTEVTQAVLHYGFGVLGLHRIDLRVLAYNTRAIRCYLRCGFVEEGRERDAALVENEWHDDVIMGILEDEVRTL
jgi:ribosomal-protein-alanine N-acetyltransferase